MIVLCRDDSENSHTSNEEVCDNRYYEREGPPAENEDKTSAGISLPQIDS